MSAFGRLWHRAPIWRRALYLTGIAATLAVLFPPPSLAPYLGITPIAPAGPGPTAVLATDATPGQRPATQTPGSSPSAASPAVPAIARNTPQPGAIYSDRLPFGVQSVPLPVGRWLALASQTGETPNGPALSVFLALELGGRVIAAASITGSVAADPKEAGYPAPLEAQIPNFYYRRVFSSVDHGLVDLWVTGVTSTTKWDDTYRHAVISAMQRQGVVVPAKFATVVYRLADRRNWLSAEFMFTDPGRDSARVRPWTEVALLPDTADVPYVEKVRRWGKAWHAIMQRGFAGGSWRPDEARIALP